MYSRGSVVTRIRRNKQKQKNEEEQPQQEYGTPREVLLILLHCSIVRATSSCAPVRVLTPYELQIYCHKIRELPIALYSIVQCEQRPPVRPPACAVDGNQRELHYSLHSLRNSIRIYKDDTVRCCRSRNFQDRSHESSWCNSRRPREALQYY